MNRWLPVALSVALALGTATRATGAPLDLFDMKAMRTLADAAWVIDARSQAPLDDYVVIVCPSRRARRAERDGDLRAYIRQMRQARADRVIVVRPAEAGTGPTFAVYFKRWKPVGYVASEPENGQATETSVAARYEPVSGNEPTSRAPIFEPGRLKLADGGELEAYRFAGWAGPDWKYRPN
jgi:hypothetical protein